MPRARSTNAADGHSLSLPDLPLDLLALISSHLECADKGSLRRAYRDAWHAPFLQPTRITLDLSSVEAQTAFDDSLIVRCLAAFPKHCSLVSMHFKSHAPAEGFKDFQKHQGVLEGFMRALKHAAEQEGMKDLLKQVKHLQMTNLISGEKMYYLDVHERGHYNHLRKEAMALLKSSFPNVVRLSLKDSLMPRYLRRENSQVQALHIAGNSWPSSYKLPQIHNVKELFAVPLPSEVALHLSHYFPDLQQLHVPKVTPGFLLDLLRAASLIPSLTSVRVDTVHLCQLHETTLSQESCAVLSSHLSVLPFNFAGTCDFNGVMASRLGQAASMLRDSHLGRRVKCLLFPWPYQSIIEAVPEILQACPGVTSIVCEHVRLDASPGFCDPNSISVRVFRTFRKDPSSNIKASKEMMEELRAAGWLGVVREGGVRVHITVRAEFSAELVSEVYQL